MDLHSRVMEILDGRVKMGAAKPTKKSQKVLNRVPPRDAPKSRKVPTKAPRSKEVPSYGVHEGKYFKHHYPTQADVKARIESAAPDVQVALHDLLTGTGCMECCECCGGVRIAGRQVSKSRGGMKKCRKGCKHIRCAAAKGGYATTATSEMLMHTSKEGGAKKNKGKKTSKKGKKEEKKMSAAYPKKRACNDWVSYVKEYAKLNGITYGEALKEAGPSYRAQAP